MGIWGWGTRWHSGQVGQGTDLGVMAGCSQQSDRSPKGHRDGRQGPGWAFRTGSKNLGRRVLRMALPPADCHSLSRLRRKVLGPLHIPCEDKDLVTLHTPTTGSGAPQTPLVSETSDTWMLEP